jgi:hypothetical protein
MGTIVFLAARWFTGGVEANDYQWIGLLVSLDSIALLQFLRWRKTS